jgi:hypothetical protein
VASTHVHQHEGHEETKLSSTAAFAVELIECDPTRRGYTPIPNYFKHFWTPLIGHKVASVYEMICSFAHGDKDDCYPTIGLLAASLAIDKHDLTGRQRRDSRPGRTAAYYQKGIFAMLEHFGLLRIVIEPGRWKKCYTFRVVKFPPLLTDDQLAQLPPMLQKRHQRLLARCQKDQEKLQQQAERRRQQQEHREARASRTAEKPVGDAATQHSVTPSPTLGDAATHDLNTQGTIQLNTLPSSTATEAEHVREFYKNVGQERVSQQKVNAGVQTIRNLKGQGFSLVDIVFAMTWITSHLDLFGGKVHSLALLPQVIGQAMQAKEAVEKREAKKQRIVTEDQQQDAEIQRRQELEQLYQSLSPNDQAALRTVAVEGLLGKGIKKSFLLESLVKSEICRLLGEEQLKEETNPTTVQNHQVPGH